MAIKDPGGAPGPRDGRHARWDAHRAERRTALVDAALEVLGESGGDFGLDQVAARAGVTKPVIYRYFGDRAGLVAAMAERATAILLDEWVVPAVRAEDPPWARIRASVDGFLGFVSDRPQLYRLVVRHDDMAAGKEAIAAAVGVVLGDFLRAGAADVGTAEVWAHGLVGFVQNVADWWSGRGTIGRAALADYLTELVWAQTDGLARRYGVVLDPDAPLRPADVAEQAAGTGQGIEQGGHGRAAG